MDTSVKNTEDSNDESLEVLQLSLQEKTLQFNQVESINKSLSDKNKELETRVAFLQNALEEKDTEFKTLEEDRIFLRQNIKKASAHWFERKAKLSESESDFLTDNYSRQNSSGSENKVPKYTDSSVQVNFKPEIKCPPMKEEEYHITVSELAYKTEQLELNERKHADLTKRLYEYEKIIDDQEFVIHGMNDQLNTYFEDNQNMSRQINLLNKLFEELEMTDSTTVNKVNPPEADHSHVSNLPTDDDFSDMAGSVSKTYIKLKDLIYEKKSLVTEIERLQTLNVELQRRVVQQESRLFSVSDAIHKTWLLVSDLKDQHAKIHTSESILRYELKEKRQILNKLRQELESSRKQWILIREKNLESEKEWKNIHDELAERRKNAGQEGGETMNDILKSNASDATIGESFEPPVDLLLDMGIEYGCIDPDDETSISVVAAVQGEDIHGERLQNLEEQCSYLYTKLMSSTARSLALASRLSSLHQHYGDNYDDEDDEDEEDDEDIEDEDDYNDNPNIFESDMASPDSESYDTAYVSETDAPEPNVNTNTTAPHTEGASTVIEPEPKEDVPDAMEIYTEEDSCDILSRRLINFLPKKIEILREENKKLEEKYNNLSDEHQKMEKNHNLALESERTMRRQLEDSMKHLGKCVDELKLERNGKIAEVEKELRMKVEKLDEQTASAEELEDQLEILKEKYEQRGSLLRFTNQQLNLKETEIETLKEKLSQLESKLEAHSTVKPQSPVEPSNNMSILEKTLEKFRSLANQEDVIAKLQRMLECLENSEEEIAINTLEDTTTLPSVPESASMPESEEGPVPESKLLELISSEQLKQDNLHKRIWINPCCTVGVPIQLNSGESMSWSVEAMPQTVWLTLVQHPSDPSLDTQSAQIKMVMDRTRLVTDRNPVHGTLLAKLTGIYTFVFDNKDSKYTARRITLKFGIKDSTDSIVTLNMPTPNSNGSERRQTMDTELSTSSSGDANER